jgi:peptidoglycan-N-acetylglucosamine deacetylase
MFRPGLTRFHVVAAVAIVLGIAAALKANMVLLALTIAAFAIAIGLGVTFPQIRLFGPFICRGAGPGKRVALTFDDGPDARSTPVLLDLLREAGVQAAFFSVGKRVAANPDLAARIVREGHLLENHSYSHSNATNFFTVARLREELAQTQMAVEKAAGVVPRMFRPPMGLSNPRTFAAARVLGLKVIGWTVRGLDTKINEPERIVARILRGVKPGAIILLHDGNVPPERLSATVKLLLDSLRKLGYEVVRLDRMLT